MREPRRWSERFRTAVSRSLTVVLALVAVSGAACRTGDDLAPPGGAAVADASRPDAVLVDAPLADAAVDAPPIDAAVDAPPVDAAVDAPPVDAAVDAPPVDAAIDASPIDAATDAADPVLVALGDVFTFGPNSVGTPVPVPGATDGSLYLCLSFDGGFPRMHVRRWTPDGPGPSIERTQATCGGLAAIDDHRVMVAIVTQTGFPEARVMIADPAAHTATEVELAPGVWARARTVDRIAGGYLVTGQRFADLGPPTHTMLWQLDETFAVVRSAVVPIIPDTSPYLFAPAGQWPDSYLRVAAPATITTIDLTTSAPLAVRNTSFDRVRQMWYGPTGVMLAGEVGGHFAVMPLASDVPTVLADVAGGFAPTVSDQQGRVIVATPLPDSSGTVVHRVDDAQFDGANGASRLDATFGLLGRAVAPFGVPCLPGNLFCTFPGFHSYSAGTPIVDGSGRLVVTGGFIIFPQQSLAVYGRRFAMPP